MRETNFLSTRLIRSWVRGEPTPTISPLTPAIISTSSSSSTFGDTASLVLTAAVEAYRIRAVVVGLLAARASDVERVTDLRTDEVNCALKMVPDKAERVTDAFEIDAARRMERAAAVR